MGERRRIFLTWSWRLALAASVCGGVFLYAYQRDRRRGPDEPLPAPQLMGEEQRQYLWEIEHLGLVLSKQGFARLADALSRGDGDALAALLAPDFTGQALRQPREVVIANDYLNVTRQENAGGPPEPLTREQFRDRLLAYRRLFDRPPKVQLSLMALSPAETGRLDGPWRGACQLRMWGNAAAEAGKGQPPAALASAAPVVRPCEVVLYLQYEVPRPAEEALKQGGWLRSCALTQSQTARASHWLMREAAAERGIDSRRFHDNWRDGMRGTTTGGVYLCDYDRDGYLDMLVVDLNCCALYRGQPGGKFVDVTLDAGLPSRLLNPTGANLVAAFADLDGDGWEDLILDKRLYRNEAGRRFRDVTARSNLILKGDVSGIAVADYDRDGRLDLYVARLGPSKASSWLDGKCGGEGGNLLFRNRGDWQFQEVAADSGAAGGDRSTFSAVWLDADNDGWPDLYVINEFGNGVLLLNQRNGSFREHALVDGPGDFGSMGVTCGDVDNDGNIDLYVANMYSKAGNRVIGNLWPGTYPDALMAKLRSFVAGSQLYRNRGGTRFDPVGKQWQVASVGWAYGPALADLDNDGWLDLYATAGFVSQNRDEPDG